MGLADTIPSGSFAGTRARRQAGGGVAAPTCSLWSQSNTTMDPDLKAELRKKEMVILSWFATYLGVRPFCLYRRDFGEPAHLGTFAVAGLPVHRCH